MSETLPHKTRLLAQGGKAIDKILATKYLIVVLLLIIIL